MWRFPLQVIGFGVEAVLLQFYHIFSNHEEPDHYLLQEWLAAPLSEDRLSGCPPCTWLPSHNAASYKYLLKHSTKLLLIQFNWFELSPETVSLELLTYSLLLLGRDKIGCIGILD